MKNIKLYTALILMICMYTSCEDSLDINTNPLVASSADPNVLLPFVIVQYSNRHVTELGTRTMDVSQHISNCFNSPKTGEVGIFLTGNTWDMYYTQVLGNLALVENDAVKAGDLQNNVNAIAKIFKAKAFFELSSMWGDVPFSEALDGANFPSPRFDSQESVFRGAIDILDEAIVLIQAMPTSGNFDVSQGDLIYEGDMGKWERYANSLKLRIYMLIRNKDTSVDPEIVSLVNQPMMESNSEAALIRYYNTPAESNAWLRLVTAFFGPSNESTGVYAIGEPLFNLLSAGDPRFSILVSDPNNFGPAPVGVFGFGLNYALITDNVIRTDLPHIMFLPSEVSFYKAELALKGVITGDPQAYFDDGLTKILQFWGGDIPGAQFVLTQTEIDNYVNSLPPADLQSVYEQLYIESFLRPIVAWNTVRRTKVPALPLPPGTSISTILKRFPYPTDESAANPSTPANMPLDTPLWFEN